MNKNSWKTFNFRIVIYVGILSFLGLLVIRSASLNSSVYAGIVNKQIMGICVGIFLMAILSFVDYHFLVKITPLIYLLNLALLLAVKIFGENVKGAQRWVVLPLIGQLQPSEFSKIAIIFTTAVILGHFKNQINSPIVLGFLGVSLIPPMFLIYKQPDLSTTMLILFVLVVIIIMAGISMKIIAIISSILIPAFTVFIYMLLNHYDKITFLEVYQKNRILTFINPEKYLSGAYQQENSLIAIGSGGLWGKGLNNTTFESVKTGNFISESHTDFIFAIVGEELGFMGTCLVVLLLLLIVFECFLVAKKADSQVGKLYAIGAGALIGFQSFINIAVATFLMPNTGISLPFLSYGVSSLLSVYILIGIVLNIGMHRKKKQKDDFRHL